MRQKPPEMRGISLIMAIHGFEFYYRTTAGVWVQLWIPEGHYVVFTAECFHFGGANPSSHRALQAVASLVSNPDDFPSEMVCGHVVLASGELSPILVRSARMARIRK